MNHLDNHSMTHTAFRADDSRPFRFISQEQLEKEAGPERYTLVPNAISAIYLLLVAIYCFGIMFVLFYRKEVSAWLWHVVTSIGLG